MQDKNQRMLESRLVWFEAFNGLSAIITGLFIFGIVKSQPAYFVHVNTAVKCILAGWLIYRFRGTKPVQFNSFDRHACFVTGSYILFAAFADYFQFFKLFFLK